MSEIPSDEEIYQDDDCDDVSEENDIEDFIDEECTEEIWFSLRDLSHIPRLGINI